MARLNTESLQLLNHKDIPSDRLTFLVLGDSHVRTTGYDRVRNRYILDTAGERYRRILQHMAMNYSSTASFVVHGGDTIGEGNKDENMKAFAAVSKEVLFPANLPIFVSIGNHDMIWENGDLTTRIFEKYLGSVRQDIHIHGANVHLIRIPTYFPGLAGAPYFRPADLAWLKQRTAASSHVLIDFHAVLRVGKNRSFPEGHYGVLSTPETNAFFQNINRSVKAIFNHHLHTSYQYTIETTLGGTAVQIPYLITGCGGNVTSRPDCPNYYAVTWNNLNTSNPTMSYTPVRVQGL